MKGGAAVYVNSSWKTQRKEDNADKEEERRLDCQLEGDREREGEMEAEELVCRRIYHDREVQRQQP